jgi:hypothetical protein
MKADQTVSEMALEVLVRQGKALAERSGRPFDEALVEVLNTEAGYQLSGLAQGAHRNEKARKWQAALPKQRLQQSLPQGLRA